MSRTIERSIARNLYSQFSKKWRQQLREAKLYGQPNSPKKPTFNQWHLMHEQRLDAERQSSVADVAEYMYGEDPWAGATSYADTLSMSSNVPEDEGECGVVTIPIAGDVEE